MSEDYKPVPVEAARAIAEQYDKSIVIVNAWDSVHGMLHVATYGASPDEKAWAAQAGELTANALGCINEQAVSFEDYRITLAKKLATALLAFVARYGADCGDHCRNSCLCCNARLVIAEAEDFLG